jgi:4-phospho-D-threonate 3-dehydrogenase / 4-phospho-D-erythronate 3-dehydrogenase
MRLALTIGDPNGIGPEVVLKSLADESLRALIEPVVVGREEVLRYYGSSLGLESVLEGVLIEEVPGRGQLNVEPGTVSANAGSVAMDAVSRSCDMCLAGDVDGMVTAPISKEAIHLAGHRFPGHTEFLAERTGADGYVMLMASEVLRVAIVTTHIPLRRVAEAVTISSVLDILVRLDAGLRQDFGIEAPRIALLGINPHAGDGGVIGTEELDTLAPALTLARDRGIEVSGPHPADGFFGQRGYTLHDAVVACYHDQGLVPFKTLTMGHGVNVTLGLPIVRTSPDHGTAFAIAGQGRAAPSSFIAAVRMAADVVRHRKENGDG